MDPIRAHINPTVLRWARDRARYDVGRAAARLSVTPERYRAWEEGTARPTVNQLATIASVFHRPPAFFYLADPPDEPEVLHEMRQLPVTGERPDSPELALQVRLAAERRQLALDLHAEMGERPRELDLFLRLSDSPRAVAPTVRELLGVTVEEQMGWSRRGSVLKNWRRTFEEAGVLVFQIPGVPLEEMRGFAIADRPLPVVAYNSRDRSDGARTFTMFHELGHVLLGITSLDTEDSLSTEERGEVETFCSALAAEVLVPRDELLAMPAVREFGPNGFWPSEEVEDLARAFGVSAAVMVRRLWDLDRVAESYYDRLRELFDSYRTGEEDDDDGGQRGDFYRNRLVHVGYYLTGLAFRAHERGLLTTSALSGVVGTQAKYLDRLADTMHGRPTSWSEDA